MEKSCARLRTLLHASALVCASLFVSLVVAAETQPGGGPVPPQAAPSDAAAPELQEVIVTAQKRAENILSVPISIAAVSGEALEQENIKGIDDLSRLVPGVSLIPTGQATTNSAQSTGQRTVVIRGIAATAGSATTGIYIDDTPIQGRETGTVFPEVFDLDRVEVLRGPQGTLFGAGSEGGTVRFITPTPSLTTLSVYAHSEAAFTPGGAPSFEVGVAAGGPLVQNAVGIRASVWTRYDGGYIDRYNFFTNAPTVTNTNSAESYVGRVSLLLKPVEQLTITSSLYFQKIDKADSDVWWSTRGLFQSYYNIPQPTDERFYLPSLALEYDFAAFSVKSITSYYSRHQNGVNEFFHSSKQQLFYAAVPDYYLSDQISRTQGNFTQEIRFTSAADRRLTWVGGFYFANNRESYNEAEVEPLANDLWLAVTGSDIADFFGVPQLPGYISYLDHRTDREQETALFGDLTLEVTGPFKLTAGVRASHTQFSFNETSSGPFGVGADLLPLTTGGSSGQHPVTPKFGASYDLDGGGVIYATASKGYRIGGANQLLPNICQAQLESLGVHGAAPPYTSDAIWSYELGGKARLDGGRLLLSASAFWIDWSHIQGIIPLNSCAYSYTGNFGTAASRGFDFQVLYEPAHGLELSGSLAMTDAHYTESVAVPGDNTQLLVRNGDPLLFTPKWSGTVGMAYSWPLRDSLNAYARTDGTYSGRYVRTYSEGVNGYLASIRDGESITQLQLRLGARSDSWDASAFVRNLTNNHTPVSQDAGTVPGTYGYTAIRSTSLQPRTFGFAVSYHY